MNLFSVIVPVYNRPEEVKELLESIQAQSEKNFEVIIVEDGSMNTCENVIQQFESIYSIKYFYKKNSGPGPSRNYGISHCSGDYYIFLDSDCILPPDYFKELNKYFSTSDVHCYGGPDRSHASFTNIQKAISYSMTSFFTTGGIRGGKKKLTKFHPRSFNMGFSKSVFQETGGFGNMRFGEDIDLSLRIEQAEYRCHLIEEAYVYHKRRTDFKKFFKQIYNSGIARINLFLKYPKSLKLTHFFPAVFVIGTIISLLTFFAGNAILFGCLLLYLGVILADASVYYKSIAIGGLSVVATLVQMFAYGFGFIYAFVQRIIFNRKEFTAFDSNFYK